MPVNVKVTCDLCGEPAAQYPSFFDLREDQTCGPWEADPDLGHLGVARLVDLPPRISTTGCLRPGLSVCLCRTHFDAVVAGLETWLAELQIASR